MVVLLTNREYDYLLKLGGDDLISVFSTLRCHSRIFYKKKGRKGTTRTLKDATGISVNTLKKHLPKLIESRLVEVHHNGNIAIRSRKWSDQNLPFIRKRKLIPIEVNESYVETKRSCFFVRVHSNIKRQERQSEKKQRRIELLYAEPRTLKEHKAKERLSKKASIDELKNSYREDATLSNAKFDEIKKGGVSPWRGNYQKRKLIEKGFIGQKRNVFLFLEGVFSYSYMYEVRNSLNRGGLFMGSKGIYFEDSPTIFLLSAKVGCKKS